MSLSKIYNQANVEWNITRETDILNFDLNNDGKIDVTEQRNTNDINNEYNILINEYSSYDGYVIVLVDVVNASLEELLARLGISEGDYEEETIDFDIADIVVNENEETVIIGTNGEKQNLGVGNNTVVTDENGDVIVVNENGETGAVGNDEENTTEISTTFYAHQEKLYGFDKTKELEIWQSLEQGKNDKVMYKINQDNIDKKVYFTPKPQDILSVSLDHAASTEQELILRSNGITGTSELIASLDSAGEQVINRLNIQVYPKKKLNLRIIILHEENDDLQILPLGLQKEPHTICVTKGSNRHRDTKPNWIGGEFQKTGDDEIDDNGNITTGENGICETEALSKPLKTQLIDKIKLMDVLNNQVYNQAVFEWDLLEIHEITINWDLNRNEIFEMFDYGFDIGKSLGNEFEVLASVLNGPNGLFYQNKKDYFVIISDYSEPIIDNEQIVDPYGFHIKGERYTFTFGNTSPNINLTMAHELGHSAFGFYDNTYKTQQPLNLMNYVAKDNYSTDIGI